MREQVEIRSFQPQDEAGFARLVSTVLSEYGFKVDPILESDLDDPSGAYDAIWVATAASEIVGSVAVRLLGDRQTAELKRMYLQRTYRGQGIGRALLGHAVRWAEDRNCTSIVLDTSTAMTAAQSLYESAGFSRAGTRTEIGAHDSRCEILYTLTLKE
jgi:ribosomal protein S18 acetylase RimI-like enzyme